MWERQPPKVGFKSIDVYCRCGHQAVIDASHLPDDLALPEIRFRLGCTKCGATNRNPATHRWDPMQQRSPELWPNLATGHSKLAPLIDGDDVTNYRATRAAVLLTTDP
jgi:hypothetical protein